MYEIVDWSLRILQYNACLAWYPSTSSGTIITGSIPRSATRRYLIYSEADFDGFRSARATRCTDGVKFGTEAPCRISLPSLQR